MAPRLWIHSHVLGVNGTRSMLIMSIFGNRSVSPRDNHVPGASTAYRS